MWGVRTQVSDPKNRTALTTASNKVPNAREFDPYLPIILNIRTHLFHALCRLPTTSGQSSFKAIWILSRYLNDITMVSGKPYDLTDLFLPNLYYSSDSWRRFHYTPFEHWEVME